MQHCPLDSTPSLLEGGRGGRSIFSNCLHALQALSLIVLLGLAPAAQSEINFNKPIRIVCPFPPAGGVDIASRAIAQELSRSMGVVVTVENRPGAGGNIGGLEVVHAPADGTTMLMTTSGIQAINPFLYSKMPFDPNKDLQPLSVLVALNNVLVVNPALKFKSVKDIITAAKEHPGELNFASSGSGTSIHMSAEMFKFLNALQMVHIPYKGSSFALTDLMGGQVMMMFDNIPSSMPFIKSGKLRALATTGAKRDPSLPDLPTIAEAGVPGYEASVWFGLMLPASTPKEVVGKLSLEVIKAAQNPDYVKKMSEQGYTLVSSTPEQMGEMARAELNRWGPIVKASGAKAD
jgi:tripartite-type tricarboxylate transporter receptor subunit TctC